jgi:predicted metal-dependent RNase
MLEGKSKVQLLNKRLKERIIITSDDNVIHINQQVNRVALRVVSEEGRVTFARDKTQL